MAEGVVSRPGVHAMRTKRRSPGMVGGWVQRDGLR